MRKNAIEKDDFFIGQKLRTRRSELGISQSRLARIEGLTFQQIQKYESGKNRISASRLYHLARVLHVPITYFYDGLDEVLESENVDNESGNGNGKSDGNGNNNRKSTESEDYKRIENDLKKLNTAFLKIRNKILKNSIVNLAMDFVKIDKSWKGN